MPPTEDRKSAILHASAKLFARQGVASTTVRQIADEVGVYSGSLYHYFPSKDAIVDEILSSYLSGLLERYREVMAARLSPREKLEGIITASLRAATTQPHSMSIYQNEMSYIRGTPGYGAVVQATADVQQVWLEVIEAGRADGWFRTDIDPKVFYRLARDAVWLAVRWYQPGSSYSIEQLGSDCASIFLDGYAAFDD